MIVLCAFAGVVAFIGIIAVILAVCLYLTYDKPDLSELEFEARELPAELSGDPEDHKAFRTMGVRR